MPNLSMLDANGEGAMQQVHCSNQGEADMKQARMHRRAAVIAAGAKKWHREWRCLSIRGAARSDLAAASSRQFNAEPCAPRPPLPGRSERRRRRRRACSLLGRRLLCLRLLGAAVTTCGFAFLGLACLLASSSSSYCSGRCCWTCSWGFNRTSGASCFHQSQSLHPSFSLL